MRDHKEATMGMDRSSKFLRTLIKRVDLCLIAQGMARTQRYHMGDSQGKMEAS